MCIAFLAVEAHPRYPLVVLANRDEFLARPTVPISRWKGPAGIIAGRDLQAGGTWFGVNASGRLALLTNYREPPESTGKGPSRGALVAGYLDGTVADFPGHLLACGDSYAGFNVIFGPWRQLTHFSNRGPGLTPITTGLHGLSNALLDTPWPKVERGKRLLAEALKNEKLEAERLFEILDDHQRASDPELPDTGVPLELERRLSSIRIPDDGPYGSRSATVMVVEQSGLAHLWERSYQEGTEVVHVLELPG